MIDDILLRIVVILVLGDFVDSNLWCCEFGPSGPPKRALQEAD